MENPNLRSTLVQALALSLLRPIGRAAASPSTTYWTPCVPVWFNDKGINGDWKWTFHPSMAASKDIAGMTFGVGPAYYYKGVGRFRGLTPE